MQSYWPRQELSFAPLRAAQQTPAMLPVAFGIWFVEQHTHALADLETGFRSMGGFYEQQQFRKTAAETSPEVAPLWPATL